MLEQADELSSEYPQRFPPQSILTRPPPRVRPKRWHRHCESEELELLRLDSDDGDERSELRDDRLDPTDEGGEMLRIL